MSKRSLVAVFPTVSSAADAAERLAARGVDARRLHIVRLKPEDRYARALLPQEPSRAPAGARIGLAFLGGLGIMLGLLTGAGLVRVPGIGALLEPSPSMALLSALLLGLTGVLLGAAAGALVGGLMDNPAVARTRVLSEEGHGALVIGLHGDREILAGWLDDALLLGEAPEPEDASAHAVGEAMADAETDVIEHEDHWNRYL